MIKNLKYQLRRWRYRRKPESLASLFTRFQNILKLNNQILELMADMNDKSGGDYVFDGQYIRSASTDMTHMVQQLINDFNILVHGKYRDISRPFQRISKEIVDELDGRCSISDIPVIMPYSDISLAFSDLTGGKNANLAELKNKLAMPVPDGFAVTISAFQHIMAANGLVDKISEVISQWKAEKFTTSEASNKIQSMILAARIPVPVARQIRKALAGLQKRSRTKSVSWALRSSAMNEDSEHSFAGQFKTILNVPTQDVMTSFMQIMASTYSAPAMAYRREKGIKENEVAMAVACQKTVQAAISGVLFTLDPLNPEAEKITLSACWGLGAPMVDGKIQADRYQVSRQTPHQIEKTDVVFKPTQLIPLPQGGCSFEDVPKSLHHQACLDKSEILRIVRVGKKIEKYFRQPQEVEWTINTAGRLFILQTRPLNIRPHLSEMVCDLSDVIGDHPIIFANKGEIAQNGIASGRIFMIYEDDDLYRFPPGAILVAKQSSPKFAAVAGKAGGIITDTGSPTGHMATIAREFRIPTILNTGVATSLLTSGSKITMDAEQNVVYEGIIDKLCLYGFATPSFEESYEYRLLRRILRKISPLSLLDPRGKHFAPGYCRTYHDITRFIHEKSVSALIENNSFHRQREINSSTVTMVSHLPLDLVLIDIGGGIVDQKKKHPVALSQIKSKPMQAFFQGIQSNGIWDSDPVPVDFKGFMSSMTRTFSPQLADPKSIGRNLGVISENYANINLRLGYHFTIIDAYVSEQINDNYAYFRFLGGVTDQTRRGRRAKLIAMILERNDFMVKVQMDLVVGRIKKYNGHTMMRKIELLGRLVAFTRQLDVKMNDDKQIENYFLKFQSINSGIPIPAL